MSLEHAGLIAAGALSGFIRDEIGEARPTDALADPCLTKAFLGTGEARALT